MSACSTPVRLGTLVDYWLGELPAAVEAETEEHLMACAACSRRAERVAHLGDAVRDLVRRAGVPLMLTPALLASLDADGLRIRRHRADPGGRTYCTAGPDDDLVTVSLRGEFRAGERVDLLFLDAPEGLEALRVDVPVDLEHGEVSLAEPGDMIRTLPAHLARMRLRGVSREGAERTIGEYTLVHTPWPGG